jgi:hypothetical protein
MLISYSLPQNHKSQADDYDLLIAGFLASSFCYLCSDGAAPLYTRPDGLKGLNLSKAIYVIRA